MAFFWTVQTNCDNTVLVPDNLMIRSWTQPCTPKCEDLISKIGLAY